MTAANIIDRVRDILIDDNDGYERWDDNFMFKSIDEAQIRLSEEKPASLFTTTVPTTNIITLITATGDTLQINDLYKQALVNYVCYRCLFVDREEGESNRAGEFLAQYKESIG